MTFREVSVIAVREMLRWWLAGHGLHAVARLAQVDRKTVRRYVEAAVAAGLKRGDDEGKLTDELLGAVVEAVKAGRPPGEHGEVWVLLEQHRAFIEGRLAKDLTMTKVHAQLSRSIGETLPFSTFRRFCQIELGHQRNRSTVRLADGEPGSELQVDFGRMGLLFDLDSGRNRVVHALIFTAVYSRHLFVFLTFHQTFEAVIEGFEAAWEAFGGVFRVVIPDNIKAIVTQADATDPRLNDAFVEYAQARGFGVDAARVRHPRDKARVERSVPFVRESFFRGEDFLGLGDAQRRAEAWCLGQAGMRIHRTTQRRPAEVFRAEEAPALLPAPTVRYDVPIWCEPKVHPDHHVEVAKALYSVPGHLIGQRVKARADSQLVKVFFRGTVVKVHPRTPPGGRSTDPADLPAHKTAYAMRDLNQLKRIARGHGEGVGDYVARLLEGDLPWTKMRQVYRLLGLVRKFGAEPVDACCRKAAELDVVDVSLIARMLERAADEASGATSARPPTARVIPMRFARAAEEFRPGGTGGKGGRR
jgi:transposase